MPTTKSILTIFAISLLSQAMVEANILGLGKVKTLLKKDG